MNAKLLFGFIIGILVVSLVLVIILAVNGVFNKDCKECKECKDCKECTDNSSNNYSNIYEYTNSPMSGNVSSAFTGVVNGIEWNNSEGFQTRTMGGNIREAMYFLGRAIGEERFLYGRPTQDIIGERFMSGVISVNHDPMVFNFGNIFPTLMNAIEKEVPEEDIDMLRLFLLQRFTEGYIRSSGSV